MIFKHLNAASTTDRIAAVQIVLSGEVAHWRLPVEKWPIVVFCKDSSKWRIIRFWVARFMLTVYIMSM